MEEELKSTEPKKSLPGCAPALGYIAYFASSYSRAMEQSGNRYGLSFAYAGWDTATKLLESIRPPQSEDNAPES